MIFERRENRFPSKPHYEELIDLSRRVCLQAAAEIGVKYMGALNK